MALPDSWSAACEAQGYRADAQAGTISGVEAGIAFLLRTQEETLEMSVNIPANHLLKLQTRIAAADGAFSGASVEHHNFGVRVSLPGIRGFSADTLLAFIRTAATEATRLIGVAYDDKFEKDGDPAWTYVTGILGALLGAVVGIIPWALASSLLHISFWFLGAFISVASFYGYCYFRGAHSTSFAVTWIVVFSLAVMVLPGAVENVIYFMQASEEISFGAALAASFQPAVLLASLPSMGFGLLANIAGLFAIRGRVLSYTHSSQYLRRGPKRK